MDTKSDAIWQMKLEKYHEQGGMCPVCRNPVDATVGQLSHRIPQRHWCLAKWGSKVIHHRLNLVLTHPECNDAVSISNHTLEMMELADKIQEELNEADAE